MSGQEFDDGINKLVSLRRNIEDSKRQLDDINKQLSSARQELENAKSESTRLRIESKIAAEQKDQAQKDVDALRLEKDLVNSKFTEESAKRYKELRDREEDVAAREAVIQARLIESERRESLGVAQDRSLEDKARGLVQREKDCEAREADVERSRLSLEEVNAQNLKVLDRIAAERKKSAEDRALAIEEQEKYRKIAEQARIAQEEASRQLVEARATEARNLQIIGRVEIIQKLRKETEELIATSTKLPIEKVAELVENYINRSVNPVPTGDAPKLNIPEAPVEEDIEVVTAENPEELSAPEAPVEEAPAPKPSKKKK